jgi:hypothetical protein
LLDIVPAQGFNDTRVESVAGDINDPHTLVCWEYWRKLGSQGRLGRVRICCSSPVTSSPA